MEETDKKTSENFALRKMGHPVNFEQFCCFLYRKDGYIKEVFYLYSEMRYALEEALIRCKGVRIFRGSKPEAFREYLDYLAEGAEDEIAAFRSDVAFWKQFKEMEERESLREFDIDGVIYTCVNAQEFVVTS